MVLKRYCLALDIGGAILNYTMIDKGQPSHVYFADEVYLSRIYAALDGSGLSPQQVKEAVRQISVQMGQGVSRELTRQRPK
jgi:hypothetical protein